MSKSTYSSSPDDDSSNKENSQARENADLKNTRDDDAQAVMASLNKKFASLPTMEADEVENLSEESMVSLAKDRARITPELAKASALSTSETKRTEETECRLKEERSILQEESAAIPTYKRKYKNLDRCGIAAPVILSKAGWVLLAAVIAAVALLGIFLGIEFDFGTASVSTSSLKIGQTLAGARGLVFPITFSSFAALTFWSFAEEKRLHWAPLFLARLGAGLTFIGIPIVSMIIGSLHTPSGKSWGWTIVLMPILTSLLIFSTVGIKYAIVWIVQIAFPYEMVKDSRKKKYARKISGIDQELALVGTDNTNACELSKKITAYVNEFVGRTRNVWNKTQDDKKTIQQRKEAKRRRLQAEADEDLLDDE